MKTVGLLQLGRPQVVSQFDVDIRSLFQRAASKQLQTSALYLKLELLEPVEDGTSSVTDGPYRTYNSCHCGILRQR